MRKAAWRETAPSARTAVRAPFSLIALVERPARTGCIDIPRRCVMIATTTHPAALTTEEVAQLAGLTPRAVKARRTRGLAPAYFRGPRNQALYRVEDVGAWLDERAGVLEDEAAVAARGAEHARQVARALDFGDDAVDAVRRELFG